MYDFGLAKWWFRKHNSHSTAFLREGSAKAFGPDVVTLRHTRKFARRCRDYMRAYRAGAMGLEADACVRLVKTHRCALETDYTFVSENNKIAVTSVASITTSSVAIYGGQQQILTYM